MNKQIYILSGLGVDERVFQKLDFSEFSVTFIQWIIPEANESIEEYATRIIEQIASSKPILIGLSFGGMMAVEVAKQIETEKVILIASAKTKEEIPYYYRFAGKLNLHQIVSAKILKRSNFLTNWFFGTESVEEKHLLKQILIDTDPDFLKWAMDKIVRWENLSKPQNYVHIHGTKDRILPNRFSNSDIAIENGGHLMTFNKAPEITKIISNLLSQSNETDSSN